MIVITDLILLAAHVAIIGTVYCIARRVEQSRPPEPASELTPEEEQQDRWAW
jgi:hypothetical protein